MREHPACDLLLQQRVKFFQSKKKIHSYAQLVYFISEQVSFKANLPAVNTEPLAVPKMEMTTPIGTRKLAFPRTISAHFYQNIKLTKSLRMH